MFMYFRFNAHSSGHSNLIVASGTDSTDYMYLRVRVNIEHVCRLYSVYI